MCRCGRLGAHAAQICDECAATRTPLWRTMGEQTLCNACGLRRKRAAAAHHIREKRARWVAVQASYRVGTVRKAASLVRITAAYRTS